MAVDHIKLSLQGETFDLKADAFDRFPHSLLARAFSGDMRPSDIIDGAYFSGRDPGVFRRAILTLYTYGWWHWNEEDDPAMVYEELCYWGLQLTEGPSAGDRLDSVEELVGHILAHKAKNDNSMWFQIQHTYLDTIGCTTGSIYEVLYHRGDYVRSLALRRGVILRFEFKEVKTVFKDEEDGAGEQAGSEDGAADDEKFEEVRWLGWEDNVRKAIEGVGPIVLKDGPYTEVVLHGESFKLFSEYPYFYVEWPEQVKLTWPRAMHFTVKVGRPPLPKESKASKLGAARCSSAR